MMDTVSGRAWILGDNIDTDQIIQGKYLTVLDYAEMARHALEIPLPRFAKEVRVGDILVSGRNLGGGSSREEAPRVLKQLGVSCIVAESYARIFYRNCFNIGLPALIVPDARQGVEQGDHLDIDLRRGLVSNVTRGVVLTARPLPAFMVRILEAGGAVELYKSARRVAEKETTTKTDK
ncbi:MAG: 3-isopropylmalate dehydratase [Candidatus Thorarchaeota archaeon]|nr:3-isopropylmalate dehydratase [Candidatus Thorarchaeota archaeon]